jgi:hypothetical protein
MRVLQNTSTKAHVSELSFEILCLPFPAWLYSHPLPFLSFYKHIYLCALSLLPTLPPLPFTASNCGPGCCGHYLISPSSGWSFVRYKRILVQVFGTKISLGPDSLIGFYATT